jgi:hypothetical protein
MSPRHFVLAGLLIGLVPRPLIAAPPAAGQPPAARLEPGATPLAEQRYAAGRRLYASNDLAGALAEFQVADSLFPNSAKLAFNLGRVHERLGHWPEALVSYQRYLALAPQAEDATDVRAIAVILQARIAQAEAASRGALRVDCDVAGQPVEVDGRPGLEACGATWTALSEGPHIVRLHTDPLRVSEHRADVVAGQTTILALLPTPRLTAPAEVSIAEVQPAETAAWPPWAAATGGVLLATGLGLLTYHEVHNGDDLSRETHDVLKVLVPTLSVTGGATLSIGLIGFLSGGLP